MHNSVRSPITLSRAAWLRLALGVLIGLAGPAIKAQPAPPTDQQDPPARVARVADVVGDAWLFDDDTKEWTRLLRNQTVAEGDRLRTDDRARVSLSAGSTSLWLDERSDLVLDRLDEGSVQLQLDRGDLAVQVRSPDAANDLRVLTQQGQLRPERDGLYRIEQLDRGTLARTWQGRLRFEPDQGGASPTWVEAGDQVEFWWADGPRAERQRLVGDAFGDWVMAQSRNDGVLSASTQRYVSPEMTGAEELDRYGSWDQSPDYGAVWFPTQIGVDWAPYRYGHWAWTRYWGWAWVDDSPWGFAPFHYGRWVQYRGRWGWTPGAYVARPVYAPALVAFVGGGGSVGFGVTIGIGGRRPPPPSRGWVPLAPREAFIPPYRHTDTYARRLNNSRDVKPIQTPRNFSVSGAVSYPQPNRPQAVPDRRPDANMQWRGPSRGERDRDRDRGDNNNRGQALQPGRPTPQQPQIQQRPQQPQQQQQQQQQRNDDRNDRGRNRDFEQRPQQQAPAAQVQLAPQPQPQVQRPQEQQPQQRPQQDWGRRDQRERNDAERNNESRGRENERQRQPEPQQAQPQPQPQPQPQQQQQRPQPPQAQPQAQPQPQPQRQQQAMPNVQPQQPKNEDKPQRDRNRRVEQQER